MSHIHTADGQHDHVISAFIFRTDFAEPKAMLHFHKKLHSYMQFGGHIELDENPSAALAREIREESGYDFGQLYVMQPATRIKKLTESIVHPQPVVCDTHRIGDTQHFHTEVSYALITDQKPKHKLADDESKDIRLFSRAELLALPNDKIIESVREITLFMFDTCLDEWEKVAATEL